MKTKLIMIVTSVLFSLYVKAQCPLSFLNTLGCHQSVDISWSFEDCSSPNAPCGIGGSATVGYMATITIPCDPLCSSGTCNIILTITALNGCAITPQSIDWLTALAAPSGKAQIIINCGGASCGTCCDNGNALAIDTNNSTSWVN